MKTVIKKIGINGEGIGYLNRTPVFVPGALLDEEIDVKIVTKEKRYAIGSVNYIIKKSKDRIQPKCFVHHACKGCPLMIAKYPAQLQYKRSLLKQSLIKYAQVDPRKVEKVIGSEEIFGYRNQCKLPVSLNKEGQLCSGFYLPNSNIFTEMKKCIVHDRGVERIRHEVIEVLKRFGIQPYNHHTKSGIRSLVVRGFDGKYQCTLVTGHDELSCSLIEDILHIRGMYSLWQSIHTVKNTAEVFGKQMVHLGGEKQLPSHFDGLDLEVSPRSFFQLNTAQAKVLYQTIASLVKGHKKRIVEAYSGIGAISLYLRDKADEIIGIETIKDAVVNANQNAKRNHCEHVRFLCDDAASKLTYLSKNKEIDVLVVDPPRSGLDDAMLECLLRSNIKEIIYVSCNPATLGKNLAVLQEKYRVQRVIPIDMFPNTQHVETVVLLSQQKPDDTIEIDLDLDELDATSAELKATYQEIKDYVLKEFGLKVSSLYISQVKRKCGIEVGENYNLPKSENARVPQCPKEKEEAIKAALEYFAMI